MLHFRNTKCKWTIILHFDMLKAEQWDVGQSWAGQSF